VNSQGGFFGQRAVAFWTVVGGVIAVVTFVVTIVPGLASGPEPSPAPSRSTSVASPPSSPLSPPSEDPTDEPSVEPTGEPGDEPSEEPAYEPSPEPAATPHVFDFSYSGSSAYPCSVEGRLHSAYGYAAFLVVTNDSPEPIQIFWLDMAGNRQQYSTLQPGQFYRVNSFSNHAWMIADSRDECVKIFGLAVGGANVTVT
jgi:hypothetical protein